MEVARVATKTKSNLRLGGLIIPFLFAAVLIFGYYLYWSKLARQIEAQVTTAIPAGSASAIDVTGFPYRLTLEIKDLKVRAQSGLTLSASSVVATATPFNPLLWVLEGAEKPVLALPGGPAQPIKAVNLKASLRLHRKGIERASLTFDGLEASGTESWGVGKGLFHVMTRFEDDDSFAMVIDLSDIRLTRDLEGPGAILGQTIRHFFVSGPINKRQELLQSATAWRDAGGKLVIMAGEIVWGPVYLSQAKGELSLSPTHKWQGQMAGTGALRPEGATVPGLSGPINLQIRDNELFLTGLPGIKLFGASR